MNDVNNFSKYIFINNTYYMMDYTFIFSVVDIYISCLTLWSLYRFCSKLCCRFLEQCKYCYLFTYFFMMIHYLLKHEFICLNVGNLTSIEWNKTSWRSCGCRVNLSWLFRCQFYTMWRISVAYPDLKN